MPELPEVEVAARSLRAWLASRVIDRVAAKPSLVLGTLTPRALARSLVGARIEGVERRGKRLKIALARHDLHAHLGMTGKWVRRAPTDPAERFEVVRIDAGDASVRYVDPRTLGRITLVPAGTRVAAWHALGPDPLIDGLDGKTLRARLSRKNGDLKEALLDQSRLAGIGNIQAAEALWLAKLHPERVASSLTPREAGALARAIVKSVTETLEKELAGEIVYLGEKGAVNEFRVYGRHGQPCPRCRTGLTKIVQGGRSTVFCGKCQGALHGGIGP
jgi:formamidopyrimidine-DNA glycosylase